MKDEASVAQDGSPTIRRRELGGLLRSLRLSKNMTAEEVTSQLLFSPTKLSRIENGQSGATARDIRDLCNLYEVTDPAQREHLMALAREGKQRGWWQGYDLPYANYVGLEADAAAIDSYNSGLVPGLLQTEQYAEAMLRTEVPPFAPREMQHRVEARLTRQANLVRADGPAYHVIMDEAAIRRRVGGSLVMRNQLERIAEASQLPNVSIQVLPFELGAHPAMESNFSILSFAQEHVDDIVYVEGLVGNLFLERQVDLERYRRVFGRLSTMALDPDKSVTLLKGIGYG